MNPKDLSENAPGKLVRSPEGAWAFSPDPLPPALTLTWDLATVLSDADRALAELGGVASILPNPHLLILPFVHREAVLSSRIEGTQSSYEDLLAFEASGAVPAAGAADVQEVSNYVRALEHGLELLKTLPVCKRFMREVHGVLLRGVRGESKQPGEFRQQQNWIGADIQTARFVPPPPIEMNAALDALEKYLHEEPRRLPALIRLALIHYQFETIHPFLDGNGRLGRLLVTLSLCSEKLLPLPLLYLSAFFDRDKVTYTDLLLKVSQEAAWDEWIRFFLRGVAEQARDGVERSRRLLELREEWRRKLQESNASGNAIALVDELAAVPSITVAASAKKLDITVPGAQKVLDRLEQAGVVSVVPDSRPRLYVAKRVIDIFRT